MTILIPPAVDPGGVMQWCSICEIHQATHARPVCPVCTDKAAREPK